MGQKIVELSNITKRFPGVLALDNMNIAVESGEIHGLIGENGAGKSTLIKVLTGVHKPEDGAIKINGVETQLNNPNDAVQKGIACVYQELNTEPLLSVTDNIFINKWVKKKSGLLDYNYMHKKSREVMESLGQDIDPTRPAGEFGVGVQQMIEIAKAILVNAKMIIMDEPTSSLGETEVEQLMTTCRKLKSQGVGILFVSHKLEELFELCDKVTVMRDGKFIDVRPIAEWDNNSLVKAMVGRTLENQYPKEFGQKSEKPYLSVKNASVYGSFKNISFDAYGGQVLGFSGLVGAGRTEVMRAIFGADHLDEGEIYVKGEKKYFKSPKDAIRAGIAFLTEDRKSQGLVLDQPIGTNMIMANLKGFTKGLFLNKEKISKSGSEHMASLDIKATSLEERAIQLSGGNQQKVVIGKWINTEADVYIFDESTRGIDVGSKVEVYKVMNDLVKKGKCVIMVSSEMMEILGMSDQVVVMREGRITGLVNRDDPEFNQEDIMKMAWEVN